MEYKYYSYYILINYYIMNINFKQKMCINIYILITCLIYINKIFYKCYKLTDSSVPTTNPRTSSEFIHE